MPMVLASFKGIFAALSSSAVKPRPKRTLELYLMVGQCTAGRRRPPVGRGDTLAAFSARFSRRAFFCAAWWNLFGNNKNR